LLFVKCLHKRITSYGYHVSVLFYPLEYVLQMCDFFHYHSFMLFLGLLSHAHVGLCFSLSEHYTNLLEIIRFKPFVIWLPSDSRLRHIYLVILHCFSCHSGHATMVDEAIYVDISISGMWQSEDNTFNKWTLKVIKLEYFLEMILI